MSTTLRRLRAMSREELRGRSAVAIRTHASRVWTAVRPPRWDRRALRRVLSPALLDEGALTAIRRQDWDALEADARNRIRHRPARFLLDPRHAPALRREIATRWPAAARCAATMADGCAQGRLSLLGFTDLSYERDGMGIDWHLDPVHERRAPLKFWADVPYLDPATGDHKIIWELNRHQHFLALGRAYWLTGRRRYREAVVAHFQSWRAANPPLLGVNWASMLELAFRSLSWLWAIHFLLADVDQGEPGAARDGAAERRDPVWLIDMLVALDRQLAHIERNLSRYFSPNTHLTGEALALYVAGVALPELAGSARWKQLGRAILLEELDRQVCADGGHVERSTHYHRYTLDFYLQAWLTARRDGDRIAEDRFRAGVTALAEFMRAMADDTGRIPLIGDDDGGMLWPIAGRDSNDVRDSLSIAGVLLRRPDLHPWEMPEEAMWIAGPRVAAARPDTPVHPAPVPDVQTSVFPHTGFVTVRTAGGDHLTLDAGPHGYLNGGHAHADALSMTLTLAGRPLLIDPGTATYTMDPTLRDRMRAGASHNTVTVDGQSSAIPAGPFHWRSRADARIGTWRSGRGFAWAEVHHDGFPSMIHRRSVVHGAGHGWLVVDEALADGRHSLDTWWQFDPMWDITEQGTRLLATCAGARVWLLHDGGEVILARGENASGGGWCSPRYGRLTPTWTARIGRTAVLPAASVTWIGVDEAGPPALEHVRLVADSSGPSIAVRIHDQRGSVVTVVRPGDAADRDTRSTDSPEYHTNARMLQYSVRDGRLQLSIADASHTLALREGLISVGADNQVPDLHLSLSPARLELWSSAPPGSLHVQSAALIGIRQVLLNGRDAASRVGASGTLTCTADEWGGAVFGPSVTSAARQSDPREWESAAEQVAP